MGDSLFWILDDIISIRLISCAPLCKYDLTGNRLERRRLSSKSRGRDPFSPPSISPEFGHTSSWFLLLTSPASFSDQPRHLKPPDYRRSATWKLADLEARFAAVAARGKSPPAPLDSLRILNAYSKVTQKSKVATSKSEFEELEAVPTMAVMDGPLESTPSNAADVPEDPAFVNFFSTALTVGNTSNAAISAQPYQSNTIISLPSHPASVASPIVPTLQIPSPPLSTPTPLIPPVDTSESGNWTPNLVKPSLFFVPPPSSYARMMQLVSSSTPIAQPFNPPPSLQRPYGAPVLQPFPLPIAPPSLTPALTSNSGPFISKEKVRETLLVLVQVRISGYANAQSYNCI
ncbi:mRNA-decapping enzyme-like protein [Citrus sinensis]|nr:mRNA-decapping enzyme-like protein [Citrus sinensis]